MKKQKNPFGTRIDLPPGAIVTADFKDSDGDGTDDRYQTGPGEPDSRGINSSGKPILSKDSNGQPGMKNKNNGRMAGTPFGLAPTEVVEATRGRGYGLTYQPQQRGSKTTKFGGGGPLINFNPILSQQANPNISVMSAGGDITTGAGKGVGGKVGGGKVGGGKVGGGEVGGGLPSIAESGFNPADYGTGGFGRADLNQLRDQGYSDDQIRDYVDESGVNLGSRAGEQLGLGDATGGDPGQTGAQTQQQTAREKRGATLGLGGVNLKRLDTGVKKYDSPSDAKNVLAAFRTATGSSGAKQAKNISDKRMERLTSNAGIKNFDSRSDAKQLTDYLVKREKEKRGEERDTRQQVKQTRQTAKDKGEKNIIAQIKREIKRETGARPTQAAFNKAVQKANVGKKIDAKDTKKIVRAVKKAKGQKARGKGKK